MKCILLAVSIFWIIFMHGKWNILKGADLFISHTVALSCCTNTCFSTCLCIWRREIFFLAVFSVKSKAFCIQALTTYTGSRNIAPLILNLDSRLSWVVSFAWRSQKPPGKWLRDTSNKRWVGPIMDPDFSEKRISVFCACIRTLDHVL